MIFRDVLICDKARECPIEECWHKTDHPGDISCESALCNRYKINKRRVRCKCLPVTNKRFAFTRPDKLSAECEVVICSSHQ